MSAETTAAGFDRTPPHDKDAEKAVLGAMLLARRAIDDVEYLKPDDFYVPAHETIHATILAMRGRGEAVDAVTVAADLMGRGEIARVGGAPYLHELIAGVPTTSNANYYGRTVSRLAIKRRLIEAGTRVVQLGYGADGEDANEAVEQARSEVDAVSRGVARTGWIATSIDDTIDNLDQPTTVTPTPWRELNHHIGGWAPGRFYVVGARPAVGKTLIAVNAATHLARDVPVALSTLEMSEEEIHHRIIANLASVNLTRLAEHRLEADDWEKIARAQPVIRSLRLSIDDRSTVTVTDIASHARSVARAADGHLGMVVVDYLQLMESSRTRRQENRQQEVAAISRRLKLLAKELHCPVIALSQLNRGSEARHDKRPTMADLRESGALEQDADVVLLLHGDENQPGTILAAVAKNRHGTEGAFELDKYGHYARVVDQQWTPTRAAAAS